jgi:NADH-quinone oxidoreductase subunit L
MGVSMSAVGREFAEIGAGSWSVPALILMPLLGAAVLLLAGRRADRWGHLLGVATVSASFAVAVIEATQMVSRPAASRGVARQLFSWIPVGDLRVDVGLQLDQLSLAFVLLITGVGSLIHLYSIGYMSHDRDRRRFFGYLNLFIAAMLLLVLGDSFLTLYVGWEGVGLASYLLIGFWQYNPPYATAAKKAFVMNRIGDVGLSLAILIMFATFGSVSYSDVLGNATAASTGTLTAIGLMLLLAACGKSAQFPLQAWLGDAMAGPTPVSALIHAATMVTAGVYLITRAGPIFDAAPTAQLLVVIVGAVTLILGAVAGCAKDDIKKALAASTMSQIGYMILATGLGPIGYAYAILHLLTHGFFKAGMFLGAGSVMHGMNDGVDMRRYGGLATVMRVTSVTFALGWLAILGVPPFAGFYSKDKIIEVAFASGEVRSWIIGPITVLGAGITAFYMTRLVAMTFLGTRRWTDEVQPHESPATMTIPMIVLAVGSVASGFLLTRGGSLVRWLEPVTGHTEAEPVLSPGVISLLTGAVVAVGAVWALARYARRPVPAVAPVSVSPLTVAARRDLFSDAVNEAVVMRPGQYLTRTLVYVDQRGIDGAVNGLAATVGGSSGRLRRLQTGFVRSYALSMLVGAAMLVGAMLLVRL